MNPDRNRAVIAVAGESLPRSQEEQRHEARTIASGMSRRVRLRSPFYAPANARPA
jgi:hypothetical protein